LNNKNHYPDQNKYRQESGLYADSYITSLHLIEDNHGTHKQPRVKGWREKHPRFTLHFMPTSSFWLNLVEWWFRDLIEKRVRQGSFDSATKLIAAIEDCMAASNADTKPFAWQSPLILSSINSLVVRLFMRYYTGIRVGAAIFSG